ncbi:unnamed protein product [Merluccius merluccius]
MYSSNYTHVPRYTLEAQKKKQLQRSKGKSCGYYTRIIFFFSSLIQSLIIVSLVLFLVYGKRQDSAASGRIVDLEQSFDRLSLENVALKLQRKNLTKVLNLTTTEKLQKDQEVMVLRNLTSLSFYYIKEMQSQLMQCNADKYKVTALKPCSRDCTECQVQLQHMKAMAEFQQAKLNQTRKDTTILVDQLTKDRDNSQLEAIELRNEREKLQWEINSYKLKCKQDFVASLSGISNMSKAFLQKVDTLLPRHMPFQLTCVRQQENLNSIRNNCSRLSREVEDTLQQYLNSVGTQVAEILGQNSHLSAESRHLHLVYNQCTRNRTGLIQENQRRLQTAQRDCDGEKKKLLIEKKKVVEEKELQDKQMNVKNMEINHLKDTIWQLNVTCSSRNVVAPGAGRLHPYPPSSVGNPFRFPGSTPNFNTGFTGSRPSGGSAGSYVGAGSTLLLNKPATNGIGGASNFATGSTNQGSTWPSSNGVSSNRVLGGTGSLGSNRSSTWTGPGSSATGQGRLSITSTGIKVPGSSVTGGWGTGLRTGSTSTGLGLGNTGLGTSSLGRGTGSVGSIGVPGRMGVNLLQHLQDLERYANPSSME